MEYMEFKISYLSPYFLLASPLYSFSEWKQKCSFMAALTCSSNNNKKYDNAAAAHAADDEEDDDEDR